MDIISLHLPLIEQTNNFFNEEKINPHLWLETAAKIHTSGNLNRMAQRLLDDFRKKLIGPISLELP